MKGRLLLDVVVAERASIFQLLAGEDESLLIWWNTLLVLDLGLDVIDGVAWFHLQRNGLACQRLYEDLHTTTQTEHQVKGRLLLDVVVTEGASIFQLLAGEDESLLIWWNTLLVLDLGLDVIDGVAWFHLQRNGLACQRLYEDLHTTTQTKHQVKGRLLLDVVVAKSTTIFQLLASEDESLLIWWNTFLVLDLGLHVIDGITRFHL